MHKEAGFASWVRFPQRHHRYPLTDVKQVLGFHENKPALGLRNGEAGPLQLPPARRRERVVPKEADVQFPVASGVTPQ